MAASTTCACMCMCLCMCVCACACMCMCLCMCVCAYCHCPLFFHLFFIALDSWCSGVFMLMCSSTYTKLPRSSTLGTSSSSRTIAVDSKAHGNKWAVRALRVARLSPQAFCNVSPSARASLRCRALAKTILVLWSAFRLMQYAVSAWASSWRVYMCTPGAACS